MKRLLILVPLVFLCCLGCKQSEEATALDFESDIQGIKDTLEDYETAYNTCDIDRIMKAYAENAVEIRPNKPAAIGKEAIQGAIRQFFNKMTEFTFQEKYVVENVKAGGNLSVAHLTWSGVFTPKAGGKSNNGKGNWILVFNKELKIIYSIWSDETLIHQDQI